MRFRLEQHLTANPFKKDPMPLLWFLAILLIGAICAGALVIDRLNIEQFRAEERNQVLQQASVIRARLEGNVNANIQSVLGLVSVIAAEPNLQQDKFSRYASYIIQGRNQLRNLGGAPNMVISLMHPLEGNEGAIGLNLAADAAQRTAAAKAADSGDIIVAGPVNLAQGGQGFIGRVPVFTLDHEDKKLFWGLVSAVIDVERLYEDSGVVNAPIKIAIAGRDGAENNSDVFYGSADLFNESPVILSVELPSGKWRLAATPIYGWTPLPPNILWLRLVLLSIMLVLSVPVIALVINQRSRQQEQARLRSLFLRSSLGIALCDSSSGYMLRLNSTLADLLGLAPDQIPPQKIIDLIEAPQKASLEWQENLLGMGSGAKIDGRLRSADGVSHFVQITSVAIDQPGMKNLFWLMVDDVTERTKTTIELSEKTRQLQLVIDSTGVGFWDWNIPKDKLKVNESWAQIIGFTLQELEEVTESNLFDRMHPEDIPKVMQSLDLAAPDVPISGALEIRIKHKNGTWIWMLVSARIVDWKDNLPLRAVGICLDISDKKRIDQKLIESQELLEKYFSMSPAFMSITNTAGYFEKINATFVRKLGYSEDELLSRPFSSFLHPDDIGPTIRSAQDLSAKGGSAEAINRYRCTDGRYLDISWDVSFDSVTSKYYATGIDVTENIKNEKKLKHREQMLAAMSRQGRIGAWEFDIDKQQIFWSSMTKEIHQVSESYEPTLADAINFYCEGYSRDKISACVESTIDTGSSFKEELKIITQKGNELWVVATGQAEMMDGRCVRVFGSFQDVHARKIIEQELIAAKEAAERAVKVKGDFLAMMSHEIRTPINGVMGMLNLLKRTQLNQGQAHYLDVSLKSAHSLLHTINDVLDFSKVDAGKLDLVSEMFDLSDELDDVIQMMALQAETKGLSLELDRHGFEPVLVKGDKDRLRQILVNLVSNAIKFTEHGRVAIKVDMKASENILTVSVSDTGIGIDETSIASLFKPFSQVDSSSTRRFEGTGLGLVIAQKLCALMGGGISVKSKLRQGSIFTFSVKFSRVEKNELAYSSALVGTNLLLISEDGYLTNSLTDLFERSQARTIVHARIEHVDPNSLSICDFIFVDQLVLKEKMSVQALKKKLATQVNAKFVLICSQYGIPDSIELYEQGFDFTLPKPVTCLALRNVFVSVNNNRGSLTQNISAKLKDTIRVLLVEDNLINQEVATLLLEDLGFRVDLASGGVQALDMLSSSTERVYDVVLMDCLMPDMDGYEATAKIRQGLAGENQKDIPIIALTANAMSGDKERCIAAGMNDFVSKPMDDALLLAAMRRCVKRMANISAAVDAEIENLSTIDRPVWDKEFALRSVRGRPDRLAWLINQFVTSSEKELAALDQAIADEDFDALIFHAHTLKGSSGQLGCGQMHYLCNTIEIAAKARDVHVVRVEIERLKLAKTEVLLRINSSDI